MSGGPPRFKGTILALSLIECTPASAAYGLCLNQNSHRISHKLCETEFQHMKQCLDQAVKKLRSQRKGK